MPINKNLFKKLVLKCIGAILLLYILFTPVLYIIVAYDISRNDIAGWNYMIARGLMLIATIGLGIYIRKKVMEYF